MEFTIQPYRLFVPYWDAVKEDFYTHLATMNTTGDDLDGHYGFVEVNQVQEYIYGFFAQEAVEDLLKYENKKPTKLDDYAWIRTPFLIDTDKLDMFIQRRHYKAKNLNHGKLINRIESMLSQELNQAVQLFLYATGISKDVFKSLFYNEENVIKEIKVSNLQGSYIIDGVDLHNPREDLDKLRAESHNLYDAKILKAAFLEANEDENLSKSPTARAFVEGGGTVGEAIRYHTVYSQELIAEQKKAIAKIRLKTDSDFDNVHDAFKILQYAIETNKERISKFVTADMSDSFEE